MFLIAVSMVDGIILLSVSRYVLRCLKFKFHTNTHNILSLCKGFYKGPPAFNLLWSFHTFVLLPICIDFIHSIWYGQISTAGERISEDL